LSKKFRQSLFAQTRMTAPWIITDNWTSCQQF